MPSFAIFWSESILFISRHVMMLIARRRKRLWQQEHTGALAESPHTLFKELEGESPEPINCTVEVCPPTLPGFSTSFSEDSPH